MIFSDLKRKLYVKWFPSFMSKPPQAIHPSLLKYEHLNVCKSGPYGMYGEWIKNDLPLIFV